MPRYEIIVHVTRELPCETAEDAAAIVRQQVFAATGPGEADLLHLAVWREDPAPASSPLPPSLRTSLVDFFAMLDRCAGDAETAFRDRVAAILTASAPAPAAADERHAAGEPDRARPA